MGIGISLSGLASAVANMGGVGVISTVEIGLTSNRGDFGHKQNNIDAVRREIRKARQKTTGVLGVNIMMVLSNFSDMVRTSIEEGIDIIFSGAGLPLDLPKYLKKESRTKLVPIISSARAASIICNKWKQNHNYLPDAFVVEGPKAGGHLGFKYHDIENKNNTLEKLLSGVLEITNEIQEKYKKHIPVIASGGIYTGNEMFHIMKQGASAVQLGTRFIATKECDASPEFKNAIINASDEDIKIIKSPVGLPGRAIYNNFLHEADEGKRRPSFCKYNCIKTCDPKTTSFCIAEALLAAYNGNLSNGFVFTGSNAGKVHKLSTVEKIFQELIDEYNTEKNQSEQSEESSNI
jgi:nitronate monooxygenase